MSANEWNSTCEKEFNETLLGWDVLDGYEGEKLRGVERVDLGMTSWREKLKVDEVVLPMQRLFDAAFKTLVCLFVYFSGTGERSFGC